MQNCLGIYIENNLIKYAKVSKEKNDFKVESYGIKFFEELNETDLDNNDIFKKFRNFFKK